MRIPLVVVTGFLGSGKTTLINRLLARRAAHAQTTKLGVIVNELGAIDIDGALIAGGASKQVNLPGGCVCCVMGDELDRTLIELVEANPDLSAIILETTGVAEPLPIAWAVSRAPVSERVRLAAVVTLVDATMFRSSRRMSGAVDAQVAYADVLLLTKSELPGAEPAATVMELESLAPRIRPRAGTTDQHVAWLEDLLADPSIERPAPEPPGHVHDEHCGHAHAHGIASTWIAVPGSLDVEELEDQLAELPESFVRIKGIVLGVDSRDGRQAAGWYAVHRVGLRVSSERIPPPAFAEGRLVALGPSVDPAMIAACVDRARTP